MFPILFKTGDVKFAEVYIFSQNFKSLMEIINAWDETDGMLLFSKVPRHSHVKGELNSALFMTQLIYLPKEMASAHTI